MADDYRHAALRSRIDPLLQFFPHLEKWQLLGFHGGCFPGLRVSPGVRLVFSDSVAAETTDLNPVALFHRFNEPLENQVD